MKWPFKRDDEEELGFSIERGPSRPMPNNDSPWFDDDEDSFGDYDSVYAQSQETHPMPRPSAARERQGKPKGQKRHRTKPSREPVGNRRPTPRREKPAPEGRAGTRQPSDDAADLAARERAVRKSEHELKRAWDDLKAAEAAHDAELVRLTRENRKNETELAELDRVRSKLTEQLTDIDSRERAIAEKTRELDRRGRELDVRERQMTEREQGIAAREKGLDERERELAEREKATKPRRAVTDGSDVRALKAQVGSFERSLASLGYKRASVRADGSEDGLSLRTVAEYANEIDPNAKFAVTALYPKGDETTKFFTLAEQLDLATQAILAQRRVSSSAAEQHQGRPKSNPVIMDATAAVLADELPELPPSASVSRPHYRSTQREVAAKAEARRKKLAKMGVAQ